MGAGVVDIGVLEFFVFTCLSLPGCLLSAPPWSLPRNGGAARIGCETQEDVSG